MDRDYPQEIIKLAQSRGMPPQPTNLNTGRRASRWLEARRKGYQAFLDDLEAVCPYDNVFMAEAWIHGYSSAAYRFTY